MIFTDDSIKVSRFKDKEKLKKHIVDTVDKSEVKTMPDNKEDLRKNQLYASDSGIFLCNEDGAIVLEKIKDVKKSKEK